jgi:hypothetical protein
LTQFRSRSKVPFALGPQEPVPYEPSHSINKDDRSNQQRAKD